MVCWIITKNIIFVSDGLSYKFSLWVWSFRETLVYVCEALTSLSPFTFLSLFQILILFYQSLSNSRNPIQKKKFKSPQNPIENHPKIQNALLFTLPHPTLTPPPKTLTLTLAISIFPLSSHSCSQLLAALGLSSSLLQLCDCSTTTHPSRLLSPAYLLPLCPRQRHLPSSLLLRVGTSIIAITCRSSPPSSPSSPVTSSPSAIFWSNSGSTVPESIANNRDLTGVPRTLPQTHPPSLSLSAITNPRQVVDHR